MTKLDYDFKDKKLLDLALTQSGVDSVHNNERLEFIGDRVLGLTIALMLYKMYPDEDEGGLARRHAVLVSTGTLADIGISIGLDKKIRHGHLTGGKARHTIANGMEAFLGAIFLDGGFSAAQNVIQSLWNELARSEKIASKDAKTELQELVQKHANGELPKYNYSEAKGLSHSPTFTVTVSAMGYSATGQGSSKKIASTQAAEELLKVLHFKK